MDSAVVGLDLEVELVQNVKIISGEIQKHLAAKVFFHMFHSNSVIFIFAF